MPVFLAALGYSAAVVFGGAVLSACLDPQDTGDTGRADDTAAPDDCVKDPNLPQCTADSDSDSSIDRACPLSLKPLMAAV